MLKTKISLTKKVMYEKEIYCIINAIKLCSINDVLSAEEKEKLSLLW